MRDLVEKAGEAYAFYDSGASIDDMLKIVLNAATKIPKKDIARLRLSLSEMVDFRESCEDLELLHVLDSVPTYPAFRQGARRLANQVKSGRMKDWKYALRAEYDRGTNEDAGNALCTVMNGVYAAQSSHMLFPGEIVGKGDDGKYSRWEDPED